jgi:hypothetical protein
MNNGFGGNSNGSFGSLLPNGNAFQGRGTPAVPRPQRASFPVTGGSTGLKAFMHQATPVSAMPVPVAAPIMPPQRPTMLPPMQAPIMPPQRPVVMQQPVPQPVMPTQRPVMPSLPQQAQAVLPTPMQRPILPRR